VPNLLRNSKKLSWNLAANQVFMLELDLLVGSEKNILWWRLAHSLLTGQEVECETDELTNHCWW
jgi:hypothetical protein